MDHVDDFLPKQTRHQTPAITASKNYLSFSGLVLASPKLFSRKNTLIVMFSALAVSLKFNKYLISKIVFIDVFSTYA